MYLEKTLTRQVESTGRATTRTNALILCLLVIVKSIKSIAVEIGMKTVAEKVENQIQLELLQEVGIDYLQGYYTGRPVPIAEI